MKIPEFKHPETHKVCETIPDLARAVGMKIRTLESWKAAGRLPTGPGGVGYCTRQLCEILDGLAAEAHSGKASRDEDDEWDTRKRRANALLAEFELQQKMETLITRESVRDGFASFFAIMRTGLTGLPGRLGPLLEGQPRERMQEVLDAELRRLLDETREAAKSIGFLPPSVE